MTALDIWRLVGMLAIFLSSPSSSDFLVLPILILGNEAAGLQDGETSPQVRVSVVTYEAFLVL